MISFKKIDFLKISKLFILLNNYANWKL